MSILTREGDWEREPYQAKVAAHRAASLPVSHVRVLTHPPTPTEPICARTEPHSLRECITPSCQVLTYVVLCPERPECPYCKITGEAKP